MSKTVQFSVSQARTMAMFLVQLTAEGANYEVDQQCDGWNVTITGY